MRCRFSVALVVALAAAPQLAFGAGKRSFFSMPSSQQQVREAQIFDPYPLPDVGPIDTTVRPRGFQYPPPEATRGRWPRPGTFPRVQYAPSEGAIPQPGRPMPPQVDDAVPQAKVAPRRTRVSEPPMPSKPPVMDDLEQSQVTVEKVDTLREKARAAPWQSARRTRSRTTATTPATTQQSATGPLRRTIKPAAKPADKPTVQPATQPSWDLSDEPTEGPLVPPTMRTDE